MLSQKEIQRRRKEFEELSDKRKILIEKLIASTINNENENADKLSKELLALEPNECEHGKHSSLSCNDCDAIFMECFSEHFESCCCDCDEKFEEDALNEDGQCINCGNSD